MVSEEFLPGVPDNFQRLWTPHRLVYIQNGQQPQADECPFCLAPKGSDEDGLIVFRGKTCFVLLNLFPYNSGHLLVCTYRHVADYDQTTKEEASEMTELTQRGMQVLRKVAQAQGFNIGMNQGEIAGGRYSRAPAPAHSPQVAARLKLLPDNRKDQGLAENIG